ncbi:hypothetical protein JOE51_006789 [Bradyrhizobium japonicum]|uniref:hypothetical protein n=1 Tax=Bradyrhizobium diazoefficiens TaxID=1355477 RepID=UPI001B5CE763|nr:hypothetical protein [Bradyrhizobium japonicum]
MSDDRTFEERAESFFSNRGFDWSPDLSARNFVLNGPQQRAEALDQLDQEIANTDGSDIKTAADRIALQRQLRELHHKMLEVNR